MSITESLYPSAFHGAEIRVLAERLLPLAETVCRSYLPDGKREHKEWVARNPTRKDESPGSFKVNMETGIWCDFATENKGGDLVSLVAYLRGCSQSAAARELNGKFLGAALPLAKSKLRKDAWEPIVPVPDDVELPKLRHPKHGLASQSWRYLDSDGRILTLVCRFDRAGGEKEFAPMCYCRNKQTGETAWRWKGLPSPRPLYNLDKISNDPGARVLILEGEKSADAAQLIMDEQLICTTSLHGAQSPAKTDWTPLRGRDVVLWGDNDAAGRKYVDAVVVELRRVGVKRLRIIDIKKFAQAGYELSPGWDAADALAEGCDLAKIGQLQKQEGFLRDVDLSLPDYSDPSEPLDEMTVTPPEGSTNTKHDEWDEPQRIENELLPVERLPETIIPEAIRVWIADIAHRMQCPLDFVAAPALVMAGSIIGTACGIRPKQNDDWLVIPNLWGALVSRPGMLKSPAMIEAFYPLAWLEQQARVVHKELVSSYDAERESYEAERTAIRHKMQKAAKRGESLEALKQELAELKEPELLTERRYQTNDATVEKLHELISQNPRGLLVNRDELIGLFSTWDKEGHRSDRTFFLEAWSGNGSHTLDRIGRGSVHAAHLCISLFGSIQPSKLTNYLYGAISGADNDGLVQRLQLAVYPDKASWQYMDQAPDDNARKDVLVLLRELDKGEFTKYGAEPGSPQFFRFEMEAQALFKDWLSDLERRIRSEQDEPIILEHLAKYRSLMPSLALIFHLIEMISTQGCGLVSLQAAEKAAAWCDYLESHARRIYGLISNIEQKAAYLLSRKIEQGKLADGFTVRDIYRAQWSLLDNKSIVQGACDELVELGWLREQITEASFQQRGVTRYLINPRINR